MIIRKPIFLNHVNHVYSHIIHDNLHQKPMVTTVVWFSYYQVIALLPGSGSTSWMEEIRGFHQISSEVQCFFSGDFPWGFCGDWDSMGFLCGMYFTKSWWSSPVVTRWIPWWSWANVHIPGTHHRGDPQGSDGESLIAICLTVIFPGWWFGTWILWFSIYW